MSVNTRLTFNPKSKRASGQNQHADSQLISNKMWMARGRWTADWGMFLLCSWISVLASPEDHFQNAVGLSVQGEGVKSSEDRLEEKRRSSLLWRKHLLRLTSWFGHPERWWSLIRGSSLMPLGWFSVVIKNPCLRNTHWYPTIFTQGWPTARVHYHPIIAWLRRPWCAYCLCVRLD